MDTMAALALATDPPSPTLLDRKPAKRSEPIISFSMAKMIISQAIYQIIVGMIVYLKGNTWFSDKEFISEDDRIEYVSALLFNTFVFCQVFSEVNSRSITNGKLTPMIIFRYKYLSRNTQKSALYFCFFYNHYTSSYYNAIWK